MRKRLDISCEVLFERQSEFTEPRVRINTDVLAAEAYDWNEDRAWDDVARYYNSTRQ